MFGVLDRCYTFRKLRKGHAERKLPLEPEISSLGTSTTVWFCFVPTLVSDVRFFRKNILPCDGTIFIYTISAFQIVRPDTTETVANLLEIYHDALQRMRTAINSGYSVSVLGVSLGNVLAIRLAKEAEKHLDSLVSIVGGSHLGLSAWESILTRHIARQSDCESAEEYEQSLSVFSPTMYISDLSAKRIIVRLGTSDLLIPYQYGQMLDARLTKQARETGALISRRIYHGADHGAAIFFTAIENQVGFHSC